MLLNCVEQLNDDCSFHLMTQQAYVSVVMVSVSTQIHAYVCLF